MSEDAKAFGPAAQPSELREALQEARRVLLDYRTCGRCAHTYAQHSAHTYSPGYPEPHHCSRGDGCMAFVDCMLHPVLGTIDAALGDPTSGNAEGAQALEIARAEGKAEGRREMAEEAAEYVERTMVVSRTAIAGGILSIRSMGSTEEGWVPITTENLAALKEALAPMARHPLRPWRQGKKVPQNVYAADGKPIAQFHDVGTAAFVVDAVNAREEATSVSRAAGAHSPENNSSVRSLIPAAPGGGGK